MQVHQDRMAAHRSSIQHIACINVCLRVHLQVPSMRGLGVALVSADLAPAWLWVCQPSVATLFRYFVCEIVVWEPCYLLRIACTCCCASVDTLIMPTAPVVAQLLMLEHEYGVVNHHG